VLIMASVIGTTNAAARPSAARVPIIIAALRASADPAEATVNMAVPASSIRRRPSRSPARPPNSRNPPNGTMYASTIHASPPSEKCSADLIAGIATFTTVTSMASSSAARQSTESDTKQRILVIARELFARQGYTGTTIADIARELGTTTAALYYHFPSKADILGGLLAEPLVAYKRIMESLDSGRAAPADVLGAFIDLTADSQELAAVIDRDPIVLAMIDEQLPGTSRQLIGDVITVLAGPGAARAEIIRAHAAFAMVKGATMAALELGNGKLIAGDRAEILAIALRALAPG
jgi:AcrR family transcriptional regulator